MKYALLIYSDGAAWESLSEGEQKAAYGEYMAISETPGVTDGLQLQPVSTATTVRVKDGRTARPAAPG